MKLPGFIPLFVSLFAEMNESGLFKNPPLFLIGFLLTSPFLFL